MKQNIFYYRVHRLHRDYRSIILVIEVISKKNDVERIIG